MARRIVIVGGGYAGALCAVRLARKTRDEDAEVVLVDANPYFVERIRLHEDVAGEIRKRRPIADLLAGTRATLHVGRVADVDLPNRRLALENDPRSCGGSSPHRTVGTLAFDELVVATGSVAARPAIPGIERAWSCTNEDEALALRRRIGELDRGHVVVVGGGLTGIELASELGERRRGLTVTLVTDRDLASMVADTGRAHVKRVLEGLGVTVREHTRVVAFEDGSIVLANGDVVACDVAVWAGGFVASPFARTIGLAVDELDRAHVDGHLRSTSHDFVRVIGDAARVAIVGANGEPDVLRMACATAIPQGAYCADEIARSIHGAPAQAPFSFAYFTQCVSLGRKNGIVQRVDPWDAPVHWWVGGRTAAFVKEAICRYPLASIRLETYGIGYHWPKAPRLVQALGRPRMT